MRPLITQPEAELLTACREKVTEAYFLYKSIIDNVYNPSLMKRDKKILEAPEKLERIVESALSHPDPTLTAIFSQFNDELTEVTHKHCLVGILAGDGRRGATHAIFNIGVWGMAIGCSLTIPYIGIPAGLAALGGGDSIYREYLRKEYTFKENISKAYSNALERLHGLAVLRVLKEIEPNLPASDLEILNGIYKRAEVYVMAEQEIIRNGCLKQLSAMMSEIKPTFSRPALHQHYQRSI